MTGRKLSRRDFLKFSSMAAAGSVLVSCAPQTTAVPAAPAAGATAAATAAPTMPPPGPGGVALQYWPSWGNFGPVWDKLRPTDEFKQAIGNNTLEIKTGTPYEAVLTAVAAGTPPDAFSNYQYLDLMARGVLAPIDDLVKASSIVKKERYFDGNWNDGFYKDAQYGVPACESFLRYGLNYNSKMVTDAGLDPENPPLTWEDLLDWHKKLTKVEGKALKQVGLDPYDAMGGQLAIQDGFYATVSWNWKWFDVATGKFDVGNKDMADSMDIMGEFYRVAGADNMAGMRQVEGNGGWGGSYNAQVQAMIIEGYWHPGETVIQQPEVGKLNRATWAPVPAARKGAKVQGTGGHYVMFFKDSKNVKEMFKIAEFLNTDAACNIIFKEVGWLPGLKDFIAKTDPSAFPGLKFYFDSVTQATEWSSPARCPITSFANTQYTELREKVFRDQMKSADAAAEFQKRLEAEWKNQGF
jgi:maltose-binding protein MalE